MSAHLITYYACGHVQSQCKCPGPKTVHHLKENCPACRRASLRVVRPFDWERD